MSDTAPVIETLKTHYDITSIFHIEEISGHSGDTTFKIVTADKRYIVKITKNKTDTFFRTYQYVSTHLEATLPRIILTNQNACCHQSELGTFFVTEYIDGQSMEFTACRAKLLARKVARLHSIPKNSALNHWNLDSLFHDIEYDRLVQLAETDKDFLLHQLKLAKKLAELPESVVHGDLGLSNILMTPAGDVTILDWGGCGIGPRLLDVGYVFWNLLDDRLNFNEGAGKAFMDAYLLTIDLLASERELIVSACILFPMNYVLFDSDTKIRKIEWFVDHKHLLQSLVT